MRVRDQFFYPIVMPVDKNGNGPADLKDAEKLAWEVWDRELTSHASFDFLPDAIDDANRRNAELAKYQSTSAVQMTTDELQLLIRLRDNQQRGIHDVVEGDYALWDRGKSLSERGMMAIASHPRGGIFHITRLGVNTIEAALSQSQPAPQPDAKASGVEGKTVCSHCDEARHARCSYADCPFEVEQAERTNASLRKALTAERERSARLREEIADLKHDIERAQNALSLEATARIEAEETGARLSRALNCIASLHMATTLGTHSRARYGLNRARSIARSALRVKAFEFEPFTLQPVHIKLLERGVRGKYIGLSDIAGIRVDELVALGELRRAGFVEEAKGPFPPGPPSLTPSVITEAGREELRKYRKR